MAAARPLRLRVWSGAGAWELSVALAERAEAEGDACVAFADA